MYLLGAFLLTYGRDFAVRGVRNTDLWQKKEMLGDGGVYCEFYRVLGVLVQVRQGI